MRWRFRFLFLHPGSEHCSIAFGSMIRIHSLPSDKSAWLLFSFQSSLHALSPFTAPSFCLTFDLCEWQKSKTRVFIIHPGGNPQGVVNDAIFAKQKVSTTIHIQSRRLRLVLGYVVICVKRAQKAEWMTGENVVQLFGHGVVIPCEWDSHLLTRI